MFKKILSLCLAMSMIYLFAIVPVYATDLEDVYDLLDEDRVKRIDELFELRAKLALDMEGNYEEISAIDQQLADFGVEEFPIVNLREN